MCINLYIRHLTCVYIVRGDAKLNASAKLGSDLLVFYVHKPMHKTPNLCVHCTVPPRALRRGHATLNASPYRQQNISSYQEYHFPVLNYFCGTCIRIYDEN